MIALTSSLLAQNDGVAMTMAGGAVLLTLVFPIAFAVAFSAFMWWKMFSKAGQPGWASIIPIYNVIVLLQIAGKPVWWILLCMIPLVQIVPLIIMNIEIAAKFGKDGGFAVGLTLLPFIFFPILGFGSATYQGAGVPAAAA